MSGQREMIFDGLATSGEMAGQAGIPVPGVDTEPHVIAYAVPVALPHLGKAICSCGFREAGYGINPERAAQRHLDSTA